MERFAVIGLGNFGATVVRELSRLKKKVTAIDIDKAKVQALRQYTHLAVLSDATDAEFLKNLEVGDYDCFIVSTGKDSHASILITLHLKELGAKKIIVKANSEDHAKILQKVGASQTIIPEEQMATRLSHSLAYPNLIDYLPLMDEYSVAEMVTPSEFVGKKLMELQIRTRYHVQIIAVKDNISGRFTLVPGGDYRIEKNDILMILGQEKDLKDLKL